MGKSLKNSKIDLSIIIVNYNTGKLLADCLYSVRRTTNLLKDPKTEVIVVDNASTDRSIEGIERSKSVKIILNNQNLGFAKAVNQGIRKSSGEYKFLLNPDTIVRRAAISKLLEFAKNNKNIGVVGPKLLNPNGTTVQASVFHFPTALNAVKEYCFGVKHSFSKYSPSTKEPLPVDAVVGAAFLISHPALKKVGLLDEHYFMYFEDLDYCRRVKKAGLAVYYLPEAEVIHYHGVSGRGLAAEKDQWKRLVPSSKIYHGIIGHYLINIIIKIGQKIH